MFASVGAFVSFPRLPFIFLLYAWGGSHTEPTGHRAEAVAELESVTGSLETEIVKSFEALAVLNLQDDLSCDVQAHI